MNMEEWVGGIWRMDYSFTLTTGNLFSCLDFPRSIIPRRVSPECFFAKHD